VIETRVGERLLQTRVFNVNYIMRIRRFTGHTRGKE